MQLTAWEVSVLEVFLAHILPTFWSLVQIFPAGFFKRFKNTYFKQEYA